MLISLTTPLTSLYTIPQSLAMKLRERVQGVLEV